MKKQPSLHLLCAHPDGLVLLLYASAERKLNHVDVCSDDIPYLRYVFTFASACNRLAHNSLWFSFHFSSSTSRECGMKVSQLLIWLSATLIIQMNAPVMVYTSVLLSCSFSIHFALQ